jgi:predicted nucleic acid-binding Zn finger protein
VSISFTKRLKSAKTLVKLNSVKKYVIDGNSERWVVVGTAREYLNLATPVWCRCYAFQKGLYDDPFFQCKHSLAVKIAMKEGSYDNFELSSKEFEPLRADWLV